MGTWLYSQPIWLMALVIFFGTFVVAAAVHMIVMRLAVGDRARAFKGVSPGMLPPLGIIFGLLVGFIAVQVWNDFDRAKGAVASEASALRSVILLSANLPHDDDVKLKTLIARYIDNSVNVEWPNMARRRANLSIAPALLIEALQHVLTFKPSDDRERLAQREIATSLQSAFDARRQRIIVSQSSVSSIKWAGLLVQALLTLIAIAMVHSDNRSASAISLALFSAGVALSVLMIAAYNRPFTGEISVGPDLLQQVIPQVDGQGSK